MFEQKTAKNISECEQKEILSAYGLIFKTNLKTWKDICGCYGENAIWIFMKAEQKVVAMCTLGSMKSSNYHLYNVGVVPQYRHQRIASQMVKFAIRDKPIVFGYCDRQLAGFYENLGAIFDGEKHVFTF